MKVTSIFFDLDGTVYSGCSAVAQLLVPLSLLIG